MNVKDRYENYAFVSYAHKDEQFAKWLQDNMESFRLPVCVRKSSQTISNKIGHLFFDKNDTNTGNITEIVQAELLVSKYLLVICTPAAAQSQIVNEEVRIFIANGRKDDILLLMVGGEPDASDSQNECLPIDIRELTKDERPVLWDFRIGNRNKVLLNLVAYLMHVPVTSLSHYNKKRNILKRVTIYLFVSILLLSLGAFWEYNRVRYEYYVSYVNRWGVPEGIDPLTPEQASASSAVFRFEYRRTPISEGSPSEWRLECVSCINGYGQFVEPKSMYYFPTELSCSICKLDYFHGKIYSLSFYDAGNQLVSIWNVLDYEGHPQGWIDRRFHQGSSGNMMEDGVVDAINQLQIPCIKIDRDSDGYVQRYSYHANNDRDVKRSAVCDGNTVFGYDICRDKYHRIVKIVALSRDMKPFEDEDGIMSIMYTYDEITGRIAEISYLDQSGAYVNGIIRSRNKYDEHGNLIETSYYDKDGVPSLVYNSGVSVEQYIGDKYGAIKECSYLDQSSNPMNLKRGYARVCGVLDSHGNILSLSYYDEKENLTLIDEEYALLKMKYNENNNVVEKMFYGIDEKPILNSSGYACARYTYDNQNRVASVSYFDETDMPIVANKVNGARVEYMYDDDGLVASESYYDENGQPYVGQHGMKVVYKYDDRGNRIEKSFYDDHGNLFVGVDRVARFRYWYNDLGMQTEARCYGSDGELTMHRENVSIFRCEYDSLNRIAVHSFFDKEERPSVSNFRKCALIKQVYDGNKLASSATTKYNWDGNDYVEISRMQVYKDINGQVICCQFFDSLGRHCLNSDGLSSWTARYDQRGNRIECNYFGVDGEPSNIKGYNFASWKASYDHKDRRIEQSYYDVNGNLTINNHGVARWKAVYKDNGNTPYMYYYDLAGNVISIDK